MELALKQIGTKRPTREMSPTWILMGRLDAADEEPGRWVDLGLPGVFVRHCGQGDWQAFLGLSTYPEGTPEIRTFHSNREDAFEAAKTLYTLMKWARKPSRYHVV